MQHCGIGKGKAAQKNKAHPWPPISRSNFACLFHKPVSGCLPHFLEANYDERALITDRMKNCQDSSGWNRKRWGRAKKQGPPVATYQQVGFNYNNLVNSKWRSMGQTEKICAIHLQIISHYYEMKACAKVFVTQKEYFLLGLLWFKKNNNTFLADYHQAYQAFSIAHPLSDWAFRIYSLTRLQL